MLREDSSLQAGIIMSVIATGKPKSMTTKCRETGSRRSTIKYCRGWKLKIELNIEKSIGAGWGGGDESVLFYKFNICFN